MSLYTPEQVNNIRLGLHPDCCGAEVCAACGASDANLRACVGQSPDLARRLWLAAYVSDHNSDASYVLYPSQHNDGALLDEAARAIFKVLRA